MKLLLASRLAKRSAAPFSSLPPPFCSSPSSTQRHKGHVQRSLIFLSGRLPGWHLRKRKYAGDQTSPVLPLGVGLLFSRFCQSILTAMHLDWTCGNAFAEECRARVEKAMCKAIRPMCPISTSPEDVWCCHAAGTYSMELLIAFGKSSHNLESVQRIGC